MLRRHLGDEMPEQWALMGPDMQKQFSASVVQAKDSAGLLNCKTVPAELVKSLSKTKMSCELESVQGGFFPLRVLDEAGLSRRLDPEGSAEENAFCAPATKCPSTTRTTNSEWRRSKGPS